VAKKYGKKGEKPLERGFDALRDIQVEGLPLGDFMDIVAKAMTDQELTEAESKVVEAYLAGSPEPWRGY
jgi:hypothetical protein